MPNAPDNLVSRSTRITTRMRHPIAHRPRRPGGERGVVLIITLIMMLIIGLISVTAVRGLATGERMAGQTREKQRAFQLADSTLRHAERWLGAASARSGRACTGALGPTVDPVVCIDPLRNPDDDDWVDVNGNAAGSQFSPVLTSAAGAVSGLNVTQTRPDAGTVWRLPEYYIQFLGEGAARNGPVYRVTAKAWGANPGTVAVVESTFQLQSSVRDLTKP